METPQHLPVLHSQPEEGTLSIHGFDHAQRISKMLSESTLVPEVYRGKVSNCLIALEMANRIGASPLMVMQNLHVIQGKPSWSSPFIIASLNTCGRFMPLKFRQVGIKDTDSYGYEAYTKDKSGEELVGPVVDWAMVKNEGWLAKPGSKWKTMPELMFRYRAAAFFGRLYAPDILMGMQTAEEVMDVVAAVVEPEVKRESKEEERIKLLIDSARSLKDLQNIREWVPESLLELFNERMRDLS
jgi:hypothetical protein